MNLKNDAGRTRAGEDMTVKAAAEKLQCSTATIYALCAAKLLRHSRVGVGRGRIYIEDSAIDAYLAGRMTGPTMAPPERTPKVARAAFKHISVR
jgi:excisionase family DNA binding protein